MEFGKSLSISEFKEANNTEKLHVVKNPKTGKLFITGDNGTCLGAVSTKYDSADGNKRVVEIIDGEIRLWVLCNSSDENIVETL